MSTSTERTRRFRARQRGEDVPKLPPDRRVDHLAKAYAAIADALDHIDRISADDLESLGKK
jgi:hypothetical protein